MKFKILPYSSGRLPNYSKEKSASVLSFKRRDFIPWTFLFLLFTFNCHYATAQTVIFSEDFEGTTNIATENAANGVYQSTSNGACLVSQRWEVLAASSATSSYNCATCTGDAASINDSFSSGCDNTFEDYTLHLGTFSTSQTELVVKFDWGMHDSDSAPFATLIIQLWNVTDNVQEGTDLVNQNTFGNIATLTGSYNQTLTVSPNDDYEIRVTWDTGNLYFTSGGNTFDNFAQVDNFVVEETCDATLASVTVDETNCPVTYDLDINITDLGASTGGVDLLVNGVLNQTITTTGIINLTNLTGGAATTLALDTDCGQLALGTFAGCVNDNFAEAIDITNGCSTGDLSVATAGAAVGFYSPGCISGGVTSGDVGTNVIRECPAGFDNNTDWVDLWYQVDLPDGTDEMTLSVTGLGAGEILGYTLHTADPGTDAGANPVSSTNNFDCSFFDNAVTSHTIEGLADESTAPIYIRILGIAVNDGDCSTIATPNFTICTSIPQPNDVCSNAIDITVNNGGAASTGNLAAASAEGTGNDDETECGGSPDLTGDLWYVVNTPNSASASDQFRIEYTVDGGNTGDVVVAKLYGPGCFGSLIACEEITFASPVTVTFNDELLNRNQNYYIQLMGKSGTLNAITSSAEVVPENNICDQFNETFPGYDIAGGNAALDFSLATDTDGNGNKELWYQIDHSSNQSIVISIDDAGNWDGQVAITLYDYDALGSNIDCDNLVEHCNQTGIDDFALESGITFNLGTGDYVVRIEETTPDAGGDQLSATVMGTLSTETIAANATCANALNITNADQQGNLTQGQLACPPVSQQDCDGDPISSTPFDPFYASTLWYEFTVPTQNCTQLNTSTVITQATIGFSGLTTSSGAGTKNVYVQLYSDCSTVVDCGTASNDSDITFTGLTQGTTYYVEVINNTLSSTGNADFTIEQVVFPEPAPCNDNVNAAFDLGSSYISGSNFASGCTSGNAQGATANDGNNAPGANVNNVWFQFTAADNADDEGYVNIYLQSLSDDGGLPYNLTINVYQEVGGSGGIVPVGASTATANTTNTEGEAWIELGHLTVGEDYFIEITHSQAADVEVLYNLCLYDIPTTTISCISDPISVSPASGGQCGTQANDCGLYYRVEVPQGTPSGWYNFEVRGNGTDLDIQLFGQGSNSPSDDGNPSDYDQPCNPTQALNPMAGAQVTIPADGTCNGGTGESAVYNLIGSSTSESNFYYLEVRDANNAGPGCNLTPDDVCTIEVSGPFTTVTLAENNSSAPDGACAPPTLQFTTTTSSVNENGGVTQVCVEIANVDGTSVSADVIFDAGDAGTATLTTDYTLSQTLPYTVTFPASAANGDQMCFNVTGVNDTDIEGAETINFDLTNPTGTALLGENTDHTTTITDDDATGPVLQFVTTTSSVGENGGTVDVCVEISNVDGTAVTADVIFDAIDDGTATLTSDYTLDQTLPYTVMFPASAANGDQICFTVTGVNDAINEGDETINFDLTNPTGTATLGTNQDHTTTITDDDAPACAADNGTLDATGFTNTACDASGTFNVSALWTGANTTGHTQQYILVGSDNIIDEVNSTGMFTIAVAGTYTIYAINTEDGNEPANLSAGNMISAISGGCFDLDSTTESVAITVFEAITVTPTASSESCATDDQTYSYDFTITGGSGSIMLANIISSQAGTTVSDLGGGSYRISGIPSNGTTTISVTDDSGCTTASAVQVPATPVNCCGAMIGNFPGN